MIPWIMREGEGCSLIYLSLFYYSIWTLVFWMCAFLWPWLTSVKTRVQNARHYSKREFTKQRHSLKKYLWKKVKREASEQGAWTRFKFTAFQRPQQCYSQWPQGGDNPKVQQLMTAVQSFSGLLFIHKKERNSDSCFMGEVWKHYAKWKKKSDTKIHT